MDAEGSISLESVKSEMEQMGQLINEVTTKFDFCNKRFKVVRKNCTDLLDKINTDLEFRRESVQNLSENCSKLLSSVKSNAELFEKELERISSEQALNESTEEVSSNKSDLLKSEVIRRRQSELKSTFGALTYVYDIYTLIFPDLVDD